MQRLRHRLVCALVLTVGCFSESPIAATPGGPADAGSIGGDCEADADCDEGQTCSWGLCVGGDDAIEPLDGAPQPWAAVQIGCQRLHGECNDVCSNPFVNCYENAEVCAEQFTADYIKDYTFPVLDADLAARCAAQVIDQPCLDLEPDTLECNYAVHEGCVGDDDGHGTTSSPFRPGRLTLGQADSVYLCASVEEFYELELRQGQGVSVHASNAESSSLSASLHRLVPVSSDRVQLESIVSYIDINDDDDDLEPVPSDGTYLLSLRSTSNTRRVALTIHARE